MPRRPAAPANLRNGLKWRDGRPRWEPSPASRAAGISGRDLKDGPAWLARGAAIDVADLRTRWAAQVRAAGDGDAEAVAKLRQALDALPAPQSDAARLRHHLLSDLFVRASAACEAASGPFDTARVSGGPRTVRALVDAYFADPLLEHPEFGKSPSTVRLYRQQSTAFIARFGDRRVDAITRGELRSWYEQLILAKSLASGKLQLSTAAAFFAWASRHDWIGSSPCTELDMRKPAARRSFILPQEELDFVPWCDANGFEDLADAFVLGLWTGARSHDLCAVDVAELLGATWRYIPNKGKRSGRVALPGLLDVVKARVARRQAQPLAPLHGAFLVAEKGGRHTTASIGARFSEARGLAVASGAVPPSFAHRMLKDTRKTCVTRLALAGYDARQIYPWTAHSPTEADEILREHYIQLQEEGSIEMARKLEAWAQKAGLALPGANG